MKEANNYASFVQVDIVSKVIAFAVVWIDGISINWE